MTRRQWIAGLGAPALIRCGARQANTMKIEDIRFEFEDHALRTPLKFGGTVVDHLSLLNVTTEVSGANGKRARGFGSMPLGNAWSFPTPRLTYDQTLNAMKALAGRLARRTAGYRTPGHPIDITWALEPEYLKDAEAAAAELNLGEPIPKLCTLATASPFDASLHDAFGKLHERNCYHTYGPDLMEHTLDHYLGAEFRGERLNQYVQSQPKERMPMYHLVGAVDPLTGGDVKKPIGDGLPETLAEWIRFNGLTHLKIKLNGDDLRWDVERVVAVDRVAVETRPAGAWYYSLDFNERCKDVQYLLAFLRQVKEQTPAGFERIQYVEQPTKRDLRSDRANVMHEAAKIKPVVIDESLTDQESLLLAREMGYTGAALKACKGQTQALLMAAAAQKYKMYLCVQDLTCPGASLIHSASLSAYIPGVAAIEANARQFIPAANREWEKRFPDIFVVKDGTMRTAVLTGKGLGAV
jgi:L-alanine-DL-glutamate epimerase-like enolase superfamily enzyme